MTARQEIDGGSGAQDSGGARDSGSALDSGGARITGGNRISGGKRGAGGADAARGFGIPLAGALAVFAALTARLWTAPFFGEDALVVSWLRSGGITEGLADLTRPQYGLSSVRFYRPLVSLSLALQSLVSTGELWLRAANLTAYAAGIAGLAWIGFRQGLSPVGVAFVGAFAAVFPGGPGDWCWIVGRVDAFAFGFGMVGLAALFPRQGAPGIRQGIVAGALLFAAALSKEPAFALAPAAAVLVLTIHGRAGAAAVAAALAGPALAFALRLAALDFAAGGYVGAPAPGAMLAANLTLDAFQNLGHLAFGVPTACGALAVAVPFAALAVSGRGGPRLAAALAGAALLTLAPLFAALRPASDEPSQSRLFPAFYALAGLAAALAADAWIRRPALRAAALAALLTCPFLAAVRNVNIYADAAARVEEDRSAIAASTGRAPAGDGSGRPVLFANALQGYPEGAFLVLLYNLGLDERFSPPLGSSPVPVWPLRPATGSHGTAPLKVPRADALTVGGRPPHAGILLVDAAPLPLEAPGLSAIPEVLTGADARALEGGDAGPEIVLPPGPPGTAPRVVLLTPVGAAWTERLTSPLRWKSLLTAPVAGTAMPLYQILGFAVDYRVRRVLLRFEWIDNDGVPIARGPDRWLRLDSTFADYVRETLADPAFGVGPHAAGR